ncbi:MAG: ABC transporter substrate-binding protein [Acidobacteriia bacterium]|nr:ABC transporter substrate-binding protein [Terriglobia bacterium]
MDSSPHARGLAIILASASVFAASLPCAAQTTPAGAQPYASLNRDAVGYSGPGREAASDLPRDAVTIGIILPLRGARAAEGQGLLQAAQLAVEDEAAGPPPGGLRLRLAAGDEGGPWGQASSEIVRLVFEEQAVALVTSANGSIAHQAEQISNKVGVPILTLASDSATTETNIPWIFRMGPSDADQARAFALDIYQERRFQRVLLVVQADHDGRAGGDEFEKAARRMAAPQPARLAIASGEANWEAVTAQIRSHKPGAIVLWMDAQTAAGLLPKMRNTNASVPIYLCRKAALGATPSSSVSLAQDSRDDPGIWSVYSRSGERMSARKEFDRRYYTKLGIRPTAAAEEVYDMVRVIAAALRRSGPNRARLRDQLASGAIFSGGAFPVAFDPAGNTRGDYVVLAVATGSAQGLPF